MAARPQVFASHPQLQCLHNARVNERLYAAFSSRRPAVNDALQLTIFAPSDDAVRCASPGLAAVRASSGAGGPHIGAHLPLTTSPLTPGDSFPVSDLMRRLNDTSAPSSPKFLSEQNVSTTLLSFHISIGKAIRTEDMPTSAGEGEGGKYDVPNALSASPGSPAKPLQAWTTQWRLRQLHPLLPPTAPGAALGGSAPPAADLPAVSPLPPAQIAVTTKEGKAVQQVKGMGSTANLLTGDIPTCSGACARAAQAQAAAGAEGRRSWALALWSPSSWRRTAD